jgi:pimeloyl-ACP methyl ester carboxylesterase
VESLLHADPLRERSRALAMHAFYRAGRPGDALATYQDYRRLLSAELGIQPSPALRALEGQILRHAAAPDALTSPARSEAARTVARNELVRVTDPQQQIRFAASPDGVRLAYATVGSGPPLVKAANWLNHLEFDWESPVWRRLFREFAARTTFVRYDERGTGLSDREARDLSLDAWVMDLETVVDACGLERFPLLGISQGCAVCIEYAARHPERVSGLILHGGYAAGWRADPSFGPAEIARREASIEIVRHGWGEDTPAYRQMFTLTFIPGGTPAEVAWFNELQRRTVSPENAARFMEAFASIDVRHRLRDVRAPTLVLHSRGDQRIHYEKGRELAMGIPSARFVLVESSNHLILEHEPAFDAWMGEALRFLAELAPSSSPTAP